MNIEFDACKLSSGIYYYQLKVENLVQTKKMILIKMTFKETIEHSPHIITEGSIIERLKREFKYPLDDVLSNSLMIYDEIGKLLLEKIIS